MLSPDEELGMASLAAKALQGVVSTKLKPVMMNGEQYLEFEDWQLLGQFYHYTVKTGDAVLVEVDGVKGAKAHADLIDMNTGEYIGGAEAYCMRDEDRWNTRPKYEGYGDDRHKVGDEPVPWFQLASMAQTRAGAKAFRNRLAWVVVLAGYKATPAEELTGNEQGHATPDKTKHWCAEHNTAFFKTEKMRGYAHKLADGSGWHNEPNIEKPKQAPSITPDNATKTGIGEEVGKLPAEPEQSAVTAEKEAQTEGTSGTAEEQFEKIPSGKPGKPPRDMATIKTITEMYKACHTDFGLQPAQVMAELNIKKWSDLTITPVEAYNTIASVRIGKLE
jgi:hypothetical protein